MIGLILVTIITIIELRFGLKNYIFQQYVFITSKPLIIYMVFFFNKKLM